MHWAYESEFNAQWAQIRDVLNNLVLHFYYLSKDWQDTVFWQLKYVSFLKNASNESLHYLAILNDNLLKMSHSIIPYLWHLEFLWNSGLIALYIRTLNLLPVMCSSGASLPCWDSWITTSISCLGNSGIQWFLYFLATSMWEIQEVSWAFNYY